MDNEETAKPDVTFDEGPKTVEQRRNQVDKAVDALFSNLIQAETNANEGRLPDQRTMEVYGSAFVLGNILINALVEIADAQQRLAAVAEADLSDVVAAAAEQQAETIVADKMKARTDRAFIGKPMRNID